MRKDVFNFILKKSKNSKDIFLIDKQKTYGDFYKKTELFKNFINRKIKKKAIICICANYSLSFVSLIFAAYLNDNIITFINPNASKKEKLHVIKNSSANFIFFDKDLIKLKKKKNSFLDFEYINLNNKINNQIKKNDRLIIYTSGTSKKPKGVIISNKAISSNVAAIHKDLKLKKKDKTIIFSPPAYAMGVSQVLTFMAAGSGIVLYREGLKFPNELTKRIEMYKITILNISVSAFRILENFLRDQKKFRFLRIIMSGGMPLTRQIFYKYRKFFPNAKIINFYGCTENSPRISHHHIKSFTKENISFFPVGKALEGVKIKIKNLNNYTSNVGLIFISGTSLMRSYLNNKILNNKFLINRWYNTGDLGFFDRNKNLNITGRNDNTFRVGHEKLCPEEIENVIQKKFNLQEIVITKVKHKILNWIPFGIGVKGKKTKITSDAIINGISEELSNYKIPKKIVFLKKIPKTNYGKLNRKKIEIIAKKFNGKK